MNASIVNNEEGNIIAKASTVSRKRLFDGTKLDVRRENPVQNKVLRAARYFKRSVRKGCRKKRQKLKKKWKPCYICADPGHSGNFCPQVNRCSVCSKEESKNKLEEDYTSIFCLKCGSTGHGMFSCTNDYDPEDLKGIQCYVCLYFGHLCCTENSTEGPSEASCYNCGQSGHHGFECTKMNAVANKLQPVSICFKCQKGVHSPEAGEKVNKPTSAETSMVRKDAVPDKSTATKSQGTGRRERRQKRKPVMPTSKVVQSLPTMFTIGYTVPRFGQYYGNLVSNVRLSPPTAAARNCLVNSPALNQSSYGRPGLNVWLSPPAAAARNFLEISPAVNQSSYQTGFHFSHHYSNYREATHVPPNPFRPPSLLPHEIFPQGTQIPGSSQNRVQLLHQNLIHQISTSDSQMGISQHHRPPHDVPNHQISASLPHQKLQHQLSSHQTWMIPPGWPYS